MEIDAQLTKLLMEVGYLAGGYGFVSESEKIFNGIAAVRPESEYPYIGLAVTCLNANMNEAAVEILRTRALKANPDSDLAKSFLGLALKLAGMNAESQKVLQEVVDNGGAEEAVNMAKSLLEEA